MYTPKLCMMTYISYTVMVQHGRTRESRIRSMLGYNMATATATYNIIFTAS